MASPCRCWSRQRTDFGWFLSRRHQHHLVAKIVLLCACALLPQQTTLGRARCKVEVPDTLYSMLSSCLLIVEGERSFLWSCSPSAGSFFSPSSYLSLHPKVWTMFILLWDHPLASWQLRPSQSWCLVGSTQLSGILTGRDGTR